MIGLYSNLLYPHKSRNQLQRLLEQAEASNRASDVSPKQTTSVARRIGLDAVAELVAAYESGEPTTRLMEKYGISKSAVLKLLDARKVTMRRQPIPPESVLQAAKLYESGLPLNKVAKDAGYPQESVRRALLAIGVALRPRGKVPINQPNNDAS